MLHNLSILIFGLTITVYFLRHMVTYNHAVQHDDCNLNHVPSPIALARVYARRSLHLEFQSITFTRVNVAGNLLNIADLFFCFAIMSSLLPVLPSFIAYFLTLALDLIKI